MAAPRSVCRAGALLLALCATASGGRADILEQQTKTTNAVLVQRSAMLSISRSAPRPGAPGLLPEDGSDSPAAGLEAGGLAPQPPEASRRRRRAVDPQVADAARAAGPWQLAQRMVDAMADGAAPRVNRTPEASGEAPCRLHALLQRLNLVSSEHDADGAASQASPLQVRAAARTGFSPVYLVLPLLAFGCVGIAVLGLCMGADSRRGPLQQAKPPRGEQARAEQSGCSAPDRRHPASTAAAPERQGGPSGMPAPQPTAEKSLSTRGGQPAASKETPVWDRFASGTAASLNLASMRTSVPAPPTPTPGQGSIRYTFSGGVGPGSSPRDKQQGSQEELCPCLVVPAGMELVFAVRELLVRDRQQISFSIVDLQGQPLAHVIVNESSGQQCGIYMQMLDQTPLAWVRTKKVHEGAGMPEICWPSGEVFATVEKDEPVPCGRYILRAPSGQRLYTFHGDFREKAVNVVSPCGRLVCDTERCVVDFDGSPHYQVRVAPCIDAGLVLCGLLAIDKLEEGEGSGAR
mmetsp:Transcript_5654/g.15242  ORF Transcript_5654/g.15242 Transcript_5654/m.15242 type:complete len:520 (-) Transcript_5654:104-1663(-)